MILKVNKTIKLIILFPSLEHFFFRKSQEEYNILNHQIKIRKLYVKYIN